MPNKKIHRSATRDCLSGKTSHEKEPIAVIAVTTLKNLLLERTKPNPPGINRGPLTTKKSANRAVGLYISGGGVARFSGYLALRGGSHCCRKPCPSRRALENRTV